MTEQKCQAENLARRKCELSLGHAGWHKKETSSWNFTDPKFPVADKELWRFK